jgi:type 1 glutamine amidotransferase
MIKKTAILLLACMAFAGSAAQAADNGWISLFDGKTLDGWKASESPGTFSVEDGKLVVHGKRSHLFYTGPVNGANFKNFEFEADVMTTPGSNSGIYFHTTYQPDNWPGKGYECQVNTTHSDRKKTGGLYGVQDVIDNAPSKDGQWFHYYIKVVGKHVVIKIDGKTTVNWIEPEGWSRGGRKVDAGTFALQGHDPKSLVYYKNIKAKPLPNDTTDGWMPLFDGTKGLEGWKASESEGTFSVAEGQLVVHGKRSHLFYTGPVNGAKFKNFEFRADVMTSPKANSGIYFHTAYQQDDWPGKGYECQVNTTHSDRKKTGGLYGVQDVIDNAPSTDGQWFHYYIKVVGKHVTIQIDDKTTVNWIEPEGWQGSGRKIDSGTFAIQGHDPGSVVHYKNIMVKPLPDTATDGWVSLFDGKTLNGWTVNENKDTFSVADGAIQVKGPRSHCFYTGPVAGADFKDFEFQAEVMTKPQANSGIYIHTEYQETGWPAKGYECQVNTSHGDPKKTGGLWAVQDVMDNAPSKDNEWFRYYIKVRGKHITIKIDGKTTVDWTEPEGWQPPDGMPGRSLSHGTFALQGHDPGSVIYYKNIMAKPLDPIKVVVVTGGHGFEHDPFFALFEGYDDIKYVEAVQKDDSELFEDISGWDYDVIVLYNMTQKISPKRQRNFKALLKNRGVGLVAMHHCEAAFADWDEYRKIIGAKYPLKDQTIDGTACKTGTYKHDMDLTVQIADRNHPITRGLDTFDIHDETYHGVWFAGDNHVLLTTDHATSDKTIGWTRPDYGKARVVFLQGGHDGKAYANPSFRTLVARAVRWSAGQL